MPRLTTIQIAGYYLYFNSNDHEPPHFHVLKQDEWEIRVMFMQSDKAHVEWNFKWSSSLRTPSKRFLKQLGAAIEIHKSEILLEWEDKVDY